MTGPWTYAVYGIVLRSDIELDVLEPVAVADDDVDVFIRRKPGLTRQGPFPVDPWFAIEPDMQYLHWHIIGSFLVTGPDEVLVETREGVTDHLASQATLGLVTSLVLERRGLLCLHAGAVNVDGRAAVLMGDKRAGKSTTSAALMKRGHAPVTDDLVAIADLLDETATPRVQPGFASTKLYPDSIEALALGTHDSDRQIHPSLTKVQKRMILPVERTPLPLGPLFVLHRSSEFTVPSADRLAPHEALRMVMRYTFMARYGETRLGPSHLVDHMKRCGRVVSCVPVFRVSIPQDLDQLGALADTIAETAASAAPVP